MGQMARTIFTDKKEEIGVKNGPTVWHILVLITVKMSVSIRIIET